MDPFLHQHFFRQPETPKEPMEFFSRSWTSSSLLQLSNNSNPKPNTVTAADSNPEDVAGECAAASTATVSSNPFSFASSETCQLIMERIMSQSQEVSPLTSGRLSYSSGPLNGSLTDSPPVSPSDIIDDLKYCRLNSNQVMITNNHQYQNQRFGPPTGAGGGGGKTVGRWLKDRREKKKEETRAHNAQLHAAISVAGVASAIAAIAAATAASSASRKDEEKAKMDMAVCSAATLVAAQCVEAAETMGVEREHIASVISSAVNVHSAGDIMGLTATAATALRGAATLKARALREVWNVAAVIPTTSDKRRGVVSNLSDGHNPSQDNFLGICSREMLARGCELLKRTRNGDLHWKIVSVYVNSTGQVMLKMKSRMAGTITKKKKNVVLDVLKDVPAWAGRQLLVGGENRRYFALKTIARGVIEFECQNDREYQVWTQGVSRLLQSVAII